MPTLMTWLRSWHSGSHGNEAARLATACLAVAMTVAVAADAKTAMSDTLRGLDDRTAVKETAADAAIAGSAILHRNRYRCGQVAECGAADAGTAHPLVGSSDFGWQIGAEDAAKDVESGVGDPFLLLAKITVLAC